MYSLVLIQTFETSNKHVVENLVVKYEKLRARQSLAQRQQRESRFEFNVLITPVLSYTLKKLKSIG